jgi:phosphoserine phosphatase
MKIILIRHGQSKANEKRIIQGNKVDTSLSELGKEQANKIAYRLSNEKIDAIYSSDFKRAKETAEVISSHHNLDIIIDKRLRERDTGDFAGLSDRELLKNFIIESSKKNKISPIEVRLPNGESFLDILNRLKDFLYNLEKDKENIVIITHGGFIRAFLYHIEKIEEKRLKYFYDDSFSIKNTSMTIFNYNKDEITLEKFNSYEHLDFK